MLGPSVNSLFYLDGNKEIVQVVNYTERSNALIQEARTAVLSRLFDGADAGSVEDATARGTASIAPSVRNSPLPMSDGATATPAPADVPASLDHVLMQAQADFVAATASGLT